MQHLKGILLIYAVLGVAFAGIVFVLLIPERVQYAAPATEVPVVASSPTAMPEDVESRVRAHMLLSDEKPTVVTLENPDDMKEKSGLFASAQKGDIMLVYSTKVILYRVSIDKIVDIAYIK